MKQITVFLFLIVLSLQYNSRANAQQTYTTDSTAVYHFIADVDASIDKDREGKRPDPFRRFFTMDQMDYLFDHYTQALSEAAGFKFYPIDRLKKRDKRDRFWEFPQLSKSKAVKSKKAAYYMLINLEFNRAEKANGISFNSKSESNTKIGIFGSKNAVEKTPMALHVKFALFDAQGKKVKEFKTSVISKGSIGFEIDKSSIGKVEGTSRKFIPETEAELLDLIKDSALSVSAKLN
jgi:hypothetical protein